MIVHEKIKCSFCNEAAILDGPTSETGQWAYMCNSHKRFCANNKVAIHIEYKPKPDSTKAEKHVESTFVFDPIYDCSIICGHCGHEHLIEPDARGSKQCDSCGVTMVWKNHYF